MIEDKSVLDLSYKTIVGNDDSVVADVGSVVSRIKISTLKGLLGQWNDINNKPFNTLNTSYVVSDNSQLSLSPSVISKLHTHSNKVYLDKISENSGGQFTYNGNVISGVSDWEDIENKPFDDLSNDFVVSSGTLSISTDIKHTHANKTVIDKFNEVDGQLLYDGSEISGGGLDFSALTNAMTTGTLTGLTITADTTNENFDITVTGMPTISINSNDEWTIDGISTGHSCKGDNGITPSIDSISKHWMIGSTDMGVVAEGQDGLSPTATVTEDSTKVTVTVTDLSGTTTADIPKAATNIDIIKGRVDTVSDLSNVSSPYEGLVYLVGETSATVFNKYIYVDRDNIARWEVLGGNADGDYIEEDVVTDVFDTTLSYSVDDYVMHDGKLYKCTTAHTGEWTVGDFTSVNVMSEIQSGTDDYTTTERKIGKWIDGSDLYQRTFEVTGLVNKQWNNSVLGTSGINIVETPSGTLYWLFNGAINIISGINYYRESTEFSTAYINETAGDVNILPNIGDSRYTIDKAIITIKYTKPSV